jgi:hypothetical protein
LRWIEGVPAPVYARRWRGGARRRKLGVRERLGFGCFAAFLGRFGRRSARPAFVEAEIDILLELLELFLEFAGLELHLFDLPVDLPHLAFEPADPDEELRSVWLFPGIGGIAGLANFSRGTSVSLREVHLVSD